jgi:hypothetical protein
MAKDLIENVKLYLYKENQEIIDFLEKTDNKNNVFKFALKYLLYHEGADISIPHDTSDRYLNFYFEHILDKKKNSSKAIKNDDSNILEEGKTISVPNCFDD